MKAHELNTGKKLRKQTPWKFLYALPMILMVWLGCYLESIIPQNEWWTVPFWVTFAIACIFSSGFFVTNIMKYPMD